MDQRPDNIGNDQEMNEENMEEDDVVEVGIIEDDQLGLIEFSDHEDEGNESEEELSEHDEEEPSLNENNQEQSYEISRPSQHEYLGTTEALSGRTIIEEHDFVTIPVLMPSASMNLVLLPSQTLPLTVFHPIQQSMLRNVIAKDRIIGIVHTQITYNDLVQYGTTAEIFEHQTSDSGSLSVKAKGRQRFKIISTHRETTGCLVARVQILPEIKMADPLSYVRLTTHQTMSLSNTCSDAGQPMQIRKLDSVRSSKAWKVRRQSALMTPWPSWVYDLYDEEQLAIRLVNEIVSVFKFQSNIQIPRDPQELSHWASINLPLSDANRLSLLSLNSATQRLRYMLSVTDQTIKRRTLNCSYCKRKIAHTQDIFCMSTDGPQGTFVNPGGYVHEMITVTQVSGLRFIDEASTLHSWFPGYAWRIATCKTCHSHIGWMFKASKSKIKPNVFYGLTRKSVKPNVRNDEEAAELHYIV